MNTAARRFLLCQKIFNRHVQIAPAVDFAAVEMGCSRTDSLVFGILGHIVSHGNNVPSWYDERMIPSDYFSSHVNVLLHPELPFNPGF
jgi:hypothetical protein